MVNSQIIPYQLNFKYPFKISHTKRESTNNAYLILKEGEFTGIGESVYPPYYPEDRSDLIQFIHQFEIPLFDCPNALVKFLEDTYFKYNHIPFSFCALDTALLNLASKKFKLSITKLLNLTDSKPVNTSFTLGMSSYNTMKKKIDENPNFDYYKLKVDQENFSKIIDDYTLLSFKPYVVDANQGFTDLRLAQKAAKLLETDNVAYLEQPFDKYDLALHKKLKEQVNIPIIADESFQRFSDIDNILPYFDGVNVKLMKCGGLVQASKIIAKAKSLHLKTVIGCMSGSSIAIRAAQHLAHLTDWVDLDGNFLISNDPCLNYLLNNHN